MSDLHWIPWIQHIKFLNGDKIIKNHDFLRILGLFTGIRWFLFATNTHNDTAILAIKFTDDSLLVKIWETSQHITIDYICNQDQAIKTMNLYDRYSQG